MLTAASSKTQLTMLRIRISHTCAQFGEALRPLSAGEPCGGGNGLGPRSNPDTYGRSNARLPLCLYLEGDNGLRLPQNARVSTVWLGPGRAIFVDFHSR